MCQNEEIIVVGGGNSAGQAAVFLAGNCRHVHIMVRSEGLAETMSHPDSTHRGVAQYHVAHSHSDQLSGRQG